MTLTYQKAIAVSDYYNRATITWEANAHGLALTELIKNRRPIYQRRDISTGRVTGDFGWLTTGGTRGTKEYMLQTVQKYLDMIITHDIEFVSQLRNFRFQGDKISVVGADDIHDAVAIGLVCHVPVQGRRGYTGRSGWNW